MADGETISPTNPVTAPALHPLRGLHQVFMFSEGLGRFTSRAARWPCITLSPESSLLESCLGQSKPNSIKPIRKRLRLPETGSRTETRRVVTVHHVAWGSAPHPTAAELRDPAPAPSTGHCPAAESAALTSEGHSLNAKAGNRQVRRRGVGRGRAGTGLTPGSGGWKQPHRRGEHYWGDKLVADWLDWLLQPLPPLGLPGFGYKEPCVC